jgi:hypothetical protein
VAAKIERIGSRVLWQAAQAAWALCTGSSPGAPGGKVPSPSSEAPVATIMVWLMVTRIWLLVLVCQLAKKAGVLK